MFLNPNSSRASAATRCWWVRGPGTYGQSLVEFALVAPLFFFVLFALFAGGWYVLEVSAVTNAAREAVSWEIATEHFANVGTSSAPLLEPYCMDTNNTLPAGLVAAAAATAGPFAQEVYSAAGAGKITNTGTAGSSADQSTCSVTITLPFVPLQSFVRLGPTSVTSSSTAYWG